MALFSMESRVGMRGRRAGVLVLILFGAALRLYALGDKSLWLDEAFSVWMARHPLPELLGWLVRIDQHPPLYYVLLGGWMAVFGETEVALRLLSAVFSIATLPLIYVLAHHLTGRRHVALLALAFVAVSPFHIRYAQEARMYALLTFLVTLTFLLTFVLVESPPSRRDRRRLLVGLALCQAAVMGTHNVAAVFVPLALNGVVMALWVGRRNLPLRAWITAQSGALLLWLPWSVAFVQQAIGVDRRFWLQPPTVGDLVAALYSFNFAFLAPDFPAVNWIMLIFVLCAVGGFVVLRRRPAGPLLAGWLLLPVIGLLLASLRRPLFHPPSLLWVSIPYLLLLASGLDGWARWTALPVLARRLWTIGAVTFVVLNLWGTANYFAYFDKEDWRGAAAFVAEEADAGDLLLFHASWVQIPFDYYFTRVEGEVVDGDIVAPGVVAHGLPVDLFDGGELEPPMTPADLPRLQRLTAAQDRVWLIYSHNWFTDPTGLVLVALDEVFDLVSETRFIGVRVLRYERSSTDSQSTHSD
jgi:mannosyltransferase